MSREKAGYKWETDIGFKRRPLFFYDGKTGENIYAEWYVDDYNHNPTGGPDVIFYQSIY